jgi:SAM-dependent methyltransferase
MPKGCSYSRDFFTNLSEGSGASAAIVVPLVLSLLPARSVIDVGCGVGTWAAQFLANGITDVWGVDGDYVDRSQLRIPLDRFLPHDLANSLALDRSYDLAVCLEVAEHLPASRAAGLVADLTRLAPCVLFSAAIPGSPGTHHINSQYLTYWVELFRACRYEGIDPIRPLIWGNEQVEWYYQQDIVMFLNQGHALLERGFPKPQSIVHPVMYDSLVHRSPSLGTIARALPSAIARSVRYRLGMR